MVLIAARKPCYTAKNEPAPTRWKHGPVRAERASIAPVPRVVEGLIADGLGLPAEITSDMPLVAALKTAAEAAFRDENTAQMSA